MEYLLEALRQLTLLEAERELTEPENRFYVYCANTLHAADIEIPFGIEL